MRKRPLLSAGLSSLAVPSAFWDRAAYRRNLLICLTFIYRTCYNTKVPARSNLLNLVAGRKGDPTMPQPAAALAAFFATFQHNSAHGSEAETLAQFAPTFLAAGPDGAKPVPANLFGPALTKRKELFDRLGHRSTELVSLDESPLDARYTLARTRWRMTFARPDLPEEQLTVDSTYLIDTRTQQILVYLAHQDILALLRQRGIMTD